MADYCCQLFPKWCTPSSCRSRSSSPEDVDRTENSQSIYPPTNKSIVDAPPDRRQDLLARTTTENKIPAEPPVGPIQPVTVNNMNPPTVAQDLVHGARDHDFAGSGTDQPRSQEELDGNDGLRTPSGGDFNSTSNLIQPGPASEPKSNRLEKMYKAFDLRSKSKEKPPQKLPTSELSDVTNIAVSIVGIALEAVGTFGENLPGIGAVKMVQLLVDKSKANLRNERQSNELLSFIKVALDDEVSKGAQGNSEAPSALKSLDKINLEEYLEKIRGGLESYQKKGMLASALRLLCAEDNQEALRATSEGISRAFALYQMKSMTRLLEKMANVEEKQLDGVINSLILARGAIFGSYDINKIAYCTENTRVKVLEDIKRWAAPDDSDPDNGKAIFWLNGLAGTGKSTISKTTVHWAKDSKSTMLGGTFFFSRASSDRQDARLVFPTLAYQLARVIPDYRRALGKVLQDNPLICSTALATQFEFLIRLPLSVCNEHRPILIVLDALDECNPEKDADDIFSLLLGSSGPEWEGTELRVFIASRPDIHIDSSFRLLGEGRRAQLEAVLHKIDLSTVSTDIETYLNSELSRIQVAKPEHFVNMGLQNWPSNDDLKNLVKDCGQFFEYAATAIRFIGDEASNPREQLREILDIKKGTSTEGGAQLREILDIKKGTSTEGGAQPYLILDSLYLGILERAKAKVAHLNKKYVGRIRDVMWTILSAADPMAFDVLAAFLSINKGDLQTTLDHLCSVIVVPDDHSAAVRVFHTSFSDFMKDPIRCKDEVFLLKTPEHMHFIATRCMEIMVTEFSSVTVKYGDFDGPLSGSLKHACIYWPSYLSQAIKLEMFDNALAEKVRVFVGDEGAFRGWCSFRGVSQAFEKISDLCSALPERKRGRDDDISKFVSSSFIKLQGQEWLSQLMGQLVIDVGDISKEEPLHSGIGSASDFSVGWLVKHHWQGKVIVEHIGIDIVGSENPLRKLKELGRSIRICSKLAHPNVVLIIGYSMEHGRPRCYFSWGGNGTLNNFMKNYQMGWKETLDMLIGVARGLEYLHSNGIVHGDINSFNIYISNDHRPQLLVPGFDMYESQKDKRPRWRAIECFRIELERERPQSDVWAFGMVAYELLGGNVPFHEYDNDARVIRAISDGELPSKPENVHQFEDSDFEHLWWICQSCWKGEPNSRPTVKELVYVIEKLRERNPGEPKLKLFATSGSLQEVTLAGPETDWHPEDRDRVTGQIAIDSSPTATINIISQHSSVPESIGMALA